MGEALGTDEFMGGEKGQPLDIGESSTNTGHVPIGALVPHWTLVCISLGI